MISFREILFLRSYSGTSYSGFGVIVRDWCRRVETIRSSVNWSEEVTPSHAALALIPGMPAENWLRLEQKEGRLGTWRQCKEGIIARFSPPITTTQRVAMIRAMKQERSEREGVFKNRLQIQLRSSRTA